MLDPICEILGQLDGIQMYGRIEWQRLCGEVQITTSPIEEYHQLHVDTMSDKYIHVIWTPITALTLSASQRYL